MFVVIVVLASVVALLVVVGVVFLVGMRRKVPAVLDAVRRVGRAMKPLVLRTAGGPSSPTSVVEHVGRRSGRRYDTPVVAMPVDGGFVIALPYGPNTDWLKNVLAAGRATLRRAGDVHQLDHPEVVAIERFDALFDDKDRRLHRRFKVASALLLRTCQHSPA